jgi:hypothetical protein
MVMYTGGGSLTMTIALVDLLDALHEDYVVAVNEAVAADDHARVARLVADHDRRAAALTAHHEAAHRAAA